MSYRIPSDGGFRAFFDAVPGRVAILFIVAQSALFLFFADYSTSGLSDIEILLAYLAGFLPAIVVGSSLFVRRQARVAILLVLTSVVTLIIAAATEWGYFLIMSVFGVALALTIYEAKLPQRFYSGFKNTLLVMVGATILILTSHLLATDESWFSYYLVPELVVIVATWFCFAALDVVGVWKHFKRAWYYFPITFISIALIWSKNSISSGEQLVLQAAGAGFAWWAIAAISLAFLKRPMGDVVAGGIIALLILGNLIDAANG